MAALLSRSPAATPSLSSSSPPPHHRPSKKSSFLSLRRDKYSVPSADIPFPPTSSASNRSSDYDSIMSPSIHPPRDAPNSSSARPPHLKHRSRGSRRSSKSASGVRDHSPTSRRAEERQHHARDRRVDSEHGFHHFPTFEYERPSLENSNPGGSSRLRSQTGPSVNQGYDDSTVRARRFNISLLDSASSVLSQYEDSPQTPVDDMLFRDPVFSLPVVVAAPIAGVETMDALVDGMNHRYDSDDHFMGSGGMSGRSKVTKYGYHPLYHPPLPTPPPGVVLGRADSRKPYSQSRDSDEEDDNSAMPTPRRREWSRQRYPESSRNPSISTIANSSVHSRPGSSRSTDTHVGSMYSVISSKTVAPSISEIIRAHAPTSQQVRSRKSSYSHTQQSHGTVPEQPEPDTDVPRTDEETDLVSRSSVDTIAEEVQRTIRNQKSSSVSPRPLHISRSFHRNSTIMSDTTRTLSSPRSDGRRESSLFSFSTLSDQPPLPPLDLSGLTKVPTNSPSQAIAQYLRSARLTTLVTLTRHPHASRGQPLTVSLSDLGSPSGTPLVVFLGLGCVRHIMGLYDEMAECLGIRLITIDRWGLGRTDSPRSKVTAGIPEWASVVEEVLDQLHIDQCSVMAHSAGAPYALAFANKFPERIRGDICLLAPWVGGGEGAGYKWLKYVPNGLLKTAQAAEWKVQAWMIGKPPTFAFEGIGFDATASPALPATPDAQNTPVRTVSKTLSSPRPSGTDAGPRPSMSSGLFSEYDDLHDFDGRFDSRSTLERRSSSPERERAAAARKKSLSKKPSRGFLGRLKGGHSSNNPPPSQCEKPASPRTGKKLKILRSMGSLKGRSRPYTPSDPVTQSPPVPWLPPPPNADVTITLDKLEWQDAGRRKSMSTPPAVAVPTSSAPNDIPPSRGTLGDEHLFYPRANGRRSVSLGACAGAGRSRPSSPLPPANPTPETSTTPAGFQAALGNALLAASHAESAKGTHHDLLQILNHDHQPWGFSYAAYPHHVRVWYGDKDERIAENAVRWMENTMGRDKCHVKLVKGADHALMYRSAVVIDVLENISDFWHSN